MKEVEKKARMAKKDRARKAIQDDLQTDLVEIRIHRVRCPYSQMDDLDFARELASWAYGGATASKAKDRLRSELQKLTNAGKKKRFDRSKIRADRRDHDSPEAMARREERNRLRRAKYAQERIGVVPKPRGGRKDVGPERSAARALMTPQEREKESMRHYLNKKKENGKTI